ncbi:MAG: DNA primase catalytic subunit PriS [Methanobacteriales archaeon HGW-Methanobacteriales-1]|nr:MAG: DNA primase catalytic subunit PriS [Methanobacteriales archaeon HGW-Methanobacteriales-1]
MFEPATKAERKQYYTEEWDIKKLPEFINENIHNREFGFDHLGRGPNDRHRVFKNSNELKKFLRIRFPFAAYCSVAFYNKPRRRGDWLKSELIFDVDAKDIPIRSCDCDGVCEICLDEARQIVSNILDTLKDDLGLTDIHVIYSGRGYHIRILDKNVMKLNSEVRSQILKYVVGAEVPKSKYSSIESKERNYYAQEVYKKDRAPGYDKMDHYLIPFGYPAVFTKRVKYAITNMNGTEKMEEVNPKLMKDVLKYREMVQKDEWGLFKNKIGPIRYRNLVEGISKLNMGLVDAKVSIDLKRILRMPTSLHSKVSMRCMEVKNIETFDPLKEAVPKFVSERKGY